MHPTLIGQAGNGGRGAAPSTSQGSSIDSVIARISTVTAALGELTNQVTRLADTIMSSAPVPSENTKLDHPPCTLQEWTTHLEDKVTALDVQVRRFF